MDPLVDYPDFAIQRAVRLHEQLDKSKITPPDFVSDFFNVFAMQVEHLVIDRFGTLALLHPID
jgi:hypothetical protein